MMIKIKFQLRVFKNKVLREEDATGEWSKLHSEELHNLYST
jgi:hypothetical protein